MKIAKQIYKILVLCTALIFLASCGYTKEKNSDISTALVYDHSMQTDEAKEFTVDYYEGGYALITLSDGSRFRRSRRHRRIWRRILWY